MCVEGEGGRQGKRQGVIHASVCVYLMLISQCSVRKQHEVYKYIYVYIYTYTNANCVCVCVCVCVY